MSANLDQDRVRWPGSGSAVTTGSIPFGFYLTEPTPVSLTASVGFFEYDCEKSAEWAAKRMGYPIIDIELIDVNFYAAFEEALASVQSELTEKVDDYLNYVVDHWLEDNQIAIESGLRAEITEEFISGLRNLFAEHYIDVPSEKIDLVDELAGKVEELESKLNEEIERAVDLNKQLIESRKVEITHQVCEGLTATQVEKIKSLAESVEFSTEDEYKNKLENIRENYFPSGTKRADEQQLHEELGDADEKKVINDPFVNAVAQAISKTKL